MNQIVDSVYDRQTTQVRKQNTFHIPIPRPASEILDKSHTDASLTRNHHTHSESETGGV